jgi:hypothetical protein
LSVGKLRDALLGSAAPTATLTVVGVVGVGDKFNSGGAVEFVCSPSLKDDGYC